MRYSRDPHTVMDHYHPKHRVKKENQSWKKNDTSNLRTTVIRKVLPVEFNSEGAERVAT